MSKFSDGKNHHIVSPLAAWIKRRQFVERLNTLDDRILDDIGYQRFQIEDAALKTFPPVSLKAYLSALVASMHTKALQRHDERLLAAFDDRMLADIGLLRGDISGAVRGDGPFRGYSAPAVVAGVAESESKSEPKSEPAKAVVGFTTTPIPVNDDRHPLAA